MKNRKLLILLTALLCINKIIHAQIEMGSIFVGGSTKLNASSTKSSYKSDYEEEDAGESSEFEFSPQVGVFISESVVFGIELPVSSASETDTEGNELTIRSYAFAPFIRVYLGSSNIKPFLHGAAGYGLANRIVNLTDRPIEKTSATLGVIEIGGGIGIFINDHISFDIDAGYFSLSTRPVEDNTINFKSTTSGFGLGIGFTLVL